MDPIERIQADRQDARNNDDPNADLCFLALSESGQAFRSNFSTARCKH